MRISHKFLFVIFLLNFAYFCKITGGGGNRKRKEIITVTDVRGLSLSPLNLPCVNLEAFSHLGYQKIHPQSENESQFTFGFDSTGKNITS